MTVMRKPAILVLTLMAILFVACGDDEEDEMARPAPPPGIFMFRGAVIDVETNQPMADIEVGFFEELGCQAIFGQQFVQTAQDGRFLVEYRRELDTLLAAAESFDVDTSYTSFSINVRDAFLPLVEMTQGEMEVRPARDERLVGNGPPITFRVKKIGGVKVFVKDESIDNELVIFDVNLDYTEDFIPGNFTSNFGSPSAEIATLDELAQYGLDAGRSYNLEISIREGDSYENLEEWPVVKTVLFENISADFREVIELEEIVY